MTKERKPPGDFPGVKIRKDPEAEEDMDLVQDVEYNLLIMSPGQPPSPLSMFRLGDQDFTDVVEILQKKKLLLPTEVIPSVGYEAWWTSKPKEVLSVVLPLCDLPDTEREQITQYVSSMGSLLVYVTSNF